MTGNILTARALQWRALCILNLLTMAVPSTNLLCICSVIDLHGQSMLLLCSSQGGAALQDVILQTASIVLRSNSASHGQHALMTMLAHIAHCLDQTAAGELD